MELDELDLPYALDVTVLHEIEHRPFREHLDRVGVVFYERDENSGYI